MHATQCQRIQTNTFIVIAVGREIGQGMNKVNFKVICNILFFTLKVIKQILIKDKNEFWVMISRLFVSILFSAFNLPPNQTNKKNQG